MPMLSYWAPPKEEFVNPDEPKEREGLSAEEIARMEEEIDGLERDLKAADDSYGENMLFLMPFTMPQRGLLLMSGLKRVSTGTRDASGAGNDGDSAAAHKLNNTTGLCVFNSQFIGGVG